MAIRARHILESAGGLNQFDGVRILHQLARIYVDQAQYERADLLLAQGISITGAMLPATHPYRIGILLTAANLCSRRRQFSTSEQYYKRALSLSDGVADEVLRDRVLRDYARLLRQLRGKKEAKDLENRADNLVSTYHHDHLVDVMELVVR